MKYQFKVSAAWASILSLMLFVGLAIPAHAVTVERSIAADSDDAEEVLAFPGDDVLGRVDAFSSDLELGREGPNAGDAQPQLVGVRFLDITIPPSSIITGASLRFTVDNDNKGDLPLTVNITGELNPNPATYLGGTGGNPRPPEASDFNISSRDKTANSVNWDIPSWLGQVGQSGANQTTPDLTSIVQELVDQGGWASGNAMAFMLAPTPLVELGGIREAEGNASPTNTVLTIDYRVIPEPTSALLAMLGLMPLIGTGRRRR